MNERQRHSVQLILLCAPQTPTGCVVARGPPQRTCEMDHGVEMNKTDDDCGGSLLTLEDHHQ